MSACNFVGVAVWLFLCAPYLCLALPFITLCVVLPYSCVTLTPASSIISSGWKTRHRSSRKLTQVYVNLPSCSKRQPRAAAARACMHRSNGPATGRSGQINSNDRALCVSGGEVLQQFLQATVSAVSNKFLLPPLFFLPHPLPLFGGSFFYSQLFLCPDKLSNDTPIAPPNGRWIKFSHFCCHFRTRHCA